MGMKTLIYCELGYSLGIKWETIPQISAIYLYIPTYRWCAPSMLLQEKGWRAYRQPCPAAEAKEQQRQCFPALGTVPALYFFLTAPDLSLLELAQVGKLTTTYSTTNMKMAQFYFLLLSSVLVTLYQFPIQEHFLF